MNQTDKQPLITAVREGDLRRVRKLIDAGADVDSIDGDHYSALHWAAQLDSLAAAELLIFAGAQHDPADDDGDTPIFVALMHRNEEVALFLLASGADPNQNLDGFNLLHAAAAYGCDEVVDRLLQINDQQITGRDRNGRTPLHWAIQESHTTIMQQLLSAGADVNAMDSAGFTPLAQAAGEGDSEIVELLLNHNAKVNPLNIEESPLAIAVAWEHVDIVRILLQAGANPNQGDIDEATLLQHAMKLKNQGIIDILRQHGALG